MCSHMKLISLINWGSTFLHVIKGPHVLIAIQDSGVVVTLCSPFTEEVAINCYAGGINLRPTTINVSLTPDER